MSRLLAFIRVHSVVLYLFGVEMSRERDLIYKLLAKKSASS